MLRHFVTDPKIESWTALLHCVTYNEKDHALGLYRLLAPNISDKTFALQLKADLLVAFKDIRNALPLYQEAAHAYYNQGKLQEACALYQYLSLLDSNNSDHYKTLIHDIHSELKK